MIKTEEIPNLENSNFSTKVIKDIAQNILSFLKSNCTKEGHTYWLFKGKLLILLEWTIIDLSNCCKMRLVFLSSKWQWYSEALWPHYSLWRNWRQIPKSIHNASGHSLVQVSALRILDEEVALYKVLKHTATVSKPRFLNAFRFS